MQNQQKQILKTLIRANSKGQLADILNGLSSSIKGQCSQFLRMWNVYLCRYIRTRQHLKAKQILEIMRKILHFFSLMGELTNPHIPIIISNNGAAVSESQLDFGQAQSYLEAMLQYIDTGIDKILSQQQPEFVRAAELKRLEIKVRLQLAGVYSQLQKHEKAIVIADSAIRLIYQFCINIKLHLQNIPIPSSLNITKSFQKLSFIINQSDPQKISNNPNLQKIRLQLCAWKQNLQISSIHLKKLIQNDKGKSSFLSSFQIGDIMQVTSMMSYQLPTKQSIFDMIVLQQLDELIIQLSVGYFTLGTELYYQKSKKDKNTIQKYKDSFQNVYRKQQIYHLQGITLAVNAIGFQTSFVQHLIKVFNDNYSGLQVIQQTLKEESNSSIRIDDSRVEQTPIKNLLKSSLKNVNDEFNDSLFDTSVDNKFKRKSNDDVMKKRKSTNGLSPGIKDILRK